MREKLPDLELIRGRAPASNGSGLLQRKCACGGSLGLSEECTGCQAKRLSLQQPESARASASAAASTHALDDPDLGHHFTQLPIRSDHSALSDSLSDDDAGTPAPADAGTPAPKDAGTPADAGATGSCPSMKTVTLDFISLRGSARDPYADLAFANTVFAPCCVQFAAGTGVSPTQALSDQWLGGDTVMDRATGNCGSGSATSEEIAAFDGAGRAFGLSSRVRVFYVESSNPGDRGRSVAKSCATGRAAAISEMVMITNTAADRSLAHELGHILLDNGTHSVPADNLMHVTNTATGNNLTSAQCTRIFSNA